MNSGEWRTLRCVVEVKVPPSNRSSVKDLIYHVEKALFQHGKFPGILAMPRSHHPGRYDAKPRVKDFERVTRYHFAEARAPDKPRFSFELLALRALGFIMAHVTRRASREEYQSWSRDAATYLGLPEKQVNLDD